MRVLQNRRMKKLKTRKCAVKKTLTTNLTEKNLRLVDYNAVFEYLSKISNISLTYHYDSHGIAAIFSGIFLF